MLKLSVECRVSSVQRRTNGEGVFLRVAHERGGLPAKRLFGADIDMTLAPGCASWSPKAC
jgi:hypothetical protein